MSHVMRKPVYAMNNKGAVQPVHAHSLIVTLLFAA